MNIFGFFSLRGYSHLVAVIVILLFKIWATPTTTNTSSHYTASSNHHSHHRTHFFSVQAQQITPTITPTPPPPPLPALPALTTPANQASPNANTKPPSSSTLPSTNSETLETTTPSNSSPLSATTATPAPFIFPPIDKLRVCSGVHIRNDLKSFEQLRGCNIIDGPLTIALVSNHTPFESKHFDSITFPELFEVTEYLLFFRVQGLTGLSKLFPNLSVIRGRELVSNYALIIYEMMHLQTIGLPKLADIIRGSVRIENNPNLCYVNTVNWDGICKFMFTPHFIKDNNARCNNRCPETCHPWRAHPDSKNHFEESRIGNNRTSFCWSNSQCHDMCLTVDNSGLLKGLPMASNGGCCSSQCAGGCSIEGRSDKCHLCRSVSQEDKCVENCDYSLFEHKGRCITEQQCILMPTESTVTNTCNGGPRNIEISTSLKPVRVAGELHGRCQTNCPPGFEEDPTNKNKCKSCDKGKCRKVCSPPGNNLPFMVTNIESLQELSGCNVINGSIEISLKGGRNVLSELESALKDVEEIRGYLKVTRSFPIVTLGFLSHLRFINGSELDRNLYSLIIIDNPNLQELFMFNKSDSKQLKISNGKISAHLNSKLCPHRIDNLKNYAEVADWDDRDVSMHTNGDKEACNTQKLEVRVVAAKPNLVLIQFENFASKMDDPRSLLYYLVNYRGAPHGNVTMFDGRDGCNSQNDVWTTVEVPPVIYGRSQLSKAEKNQEFVVQVKPATRYALYIKTFTTGGSKGALSDLLYFETAPDTPGMPRQLESIPLSHDTLQVSWSPPAKPNGIIKRYFVTITQMPEMDDIQTMDICDSIEDRDKITKSLTQNEPTILPMTPPKMQNQDFPSQSSSDGTTTPAPAVACVKAETDVDLHEEVVTFQDMIIDIVYLKQPCFDRVASSNKQDQSRKRRSIELDLDSSQPTPENSNMGDKAAMGTFKTKSSSQSDINSNEDSGLTSLAWLAKDSLANSSSASAAIIFNPSRQKTEFNISVSQVMPDSRLVYEIKNLTHFSRYMIEVVACHGEFVSNNTSPSASYKKCGLQAITQMRTMAIDDYDKINGSSVKFFPSNETSNDNIVVWSKPERPNGAILGYRVRYRPEDGPADIWIAGCINEAAYQSKNGFPLTGVKPGTYLFSVQAISMYSGQRFWSEPELKLEIPSDQLVSATASFVIIFVCLMTLIVAVASVAYYYQKKIHDQGLLYASVNPDYVQYNPDEWEVDPTNLIVGEQIGTGSFGLVYKGILTVEKGKMNCAVKTVPPKSTAKQRMDFLREASIMKQFDTFHVVKLLGVISTTTPVYVIMEYMENGDLKQFLRKQREIHQKQNKTLVDGLYLMIAQIADGMAYLASKKFVHRDLAARNCMVDASRTVKIGDFGLTRDVLMKDYYRRDTYGRLPVRWMAPESLQDNLYTSASDVWSFGVVVWEIVTFSAYPYQGLSNDEVYQRVTNGSKPMSKPDNCPDKLYKIMEQCWKFDPSKRPTFTQILESILPETEQELFPKSFYYKQLRSLQDQTQTKLTPSPPTATGSLAGSGSSVGVSGSGSGSGAGLGGGCISSGIGGGSSGGTQDGSGDSMAQPTSLAHDDNQIPGESYPLLSWPASTINNSNGDSAPAEAGTGNVVRNRANGLSSSLTVDDEVTGGDPVPSNKSSLSGKGSSTVV